MISAQTAPAEGRSAAAAGQTQFIGLADSCLVIAEELSRAARPVVAQAIRALEEWRIRRRARATARTLRDLDDRILKDIGLHRSRIESAALSVAQHGDMSPRRWL